MKDFIDEINRKYTYDRDTGDMLWKDHKTNAAQNGTIADDIQRYKRVQVWNKYYYSHRIIWLIVFSKWPTNEIDHINGDPHDNRLVNLRDVTHKENQNNQVYHREVDYAKK